MKRENIALLALARHEPAAKRELGRRYLTGTGGFPRHEHLALEYLSHPSICATDEVARIIGEHLPLERIVALGHEATLTRAAEAGSVDAQFKLGVWLSMVRDSQPKGLKWLAAARQGGHHAAGQVLNALAGKGDSGRDALFDALRSYAHVPLDVICISAAERAAQRGQQHEMAECLRQSLLSGTAISVVAARLVKHVIQLAATSAIEIRHLSAEQIQTCLQLLVADGDMEAALILGRAYCGIGLPTVAPGQIVPGPNLRMGAALLLRAADSGSREAWMHLHRVHADHRCSVANPQLSRFFLEKAAALGDVEAQRRLGAALLKSAARVADSETAIHWLHAAATQGDQPALALLRTLVLPIGGEEEAAARAIDLIRSADPWLAARLRLSREFGLTKLEALCVDPIAGKRPWGLVVGQNAFIVLSKLSAPRAVPALGPAAADALHKVAVLYESGRREGVLVEGDWTRRSLIQRRLFARYHIGEELFFAKVSSTTLDSFRKGTKWAVRAKASLAAALTAPDIPMAPAFGSSAGDGS
jgi:TPR repeat protein